MTDAPTVSVVIVSRGRPAALQRCLVGVSQLQYAAFEVVVVADPEGIAAAQALPFADAVKCVTFEVPNISAARNLGIAQAAGEIVAFIDDDAVPEPLWLHHLTAPAVQSGVAAMGGFVRGRNGISFQWQARMLDARGHATPMQVDTLQASVLAPPPGRAVKTEGTNMAVRRDVLVDLGGFDPAFRFFLDETDLNMRLARAGKATAIVPFAQVHHGFAASVRRRADRVPADLTEIGASWAVFERKHLPEAERAGRWHDVRQDERRRLLAHMVAGRLEPRDVRRLMHGLDDGHADGMTRDIGAAPLARHAADPFRPFPTRRRSHVVLVARGLRGRAAQQRARDLVAQGHIVTVMVLSRTALYHHAWFDPDGFWVQRGGVFGRSERTGPLWRATTVSRRAQAEAERLRDVRGPAQVQANKAQ
ncbi:glycosyltransferase family 2 protein [Sulfitobacter sp. S190]|uniref:glycosyltransferase family 2 protein n=1 Tax=Sulfitobacter sp. S190 TaxID=2867022 RepID=UPI0021A93FE2|nr:glycosyltransferase family 2 protein [Sulfitobacter sp. S190]UWR22524.1 glycosyltransferase family 2 protein [Sulfitobacter sp. S190]